MTSFSDFNLDQKILDALNGMGYKEASPVQEQSIPLILQGKDLICLAETGSGKTAACAIPICHQVDTSIDHIQALIIVPTRELALQYATETQKIGRQRGVASFAIFGGEDAGLQEAKLEHGVHVLVATPGRLIDFIYSRRINLTHVKSLILDEADEMLSMGFYDDLEFIIQCLVQKHQTLLFSATMPKDIQKIAVEHMNQPIELELTKSQKSPSSIDHRFVYCRPEERERVLMKLLRELKPKQSIIFCHTRGEVEKLSNALKRDIPQVDYLHGALSQETRRMITGKFRSGRVKHLIATNIAARGLDFSEISHVFIYHLEDDPDVFVHRSGRTGRYQKTGTVVTLVTNKELSRLRRVLEAIQKKAVWIGAPPPVAMYRSTENQKKIVLKSEE